jgi:hypothetical protein
MSLTFDTISKVWVVILTGTYIVLYFSISRNQCEEFMHKRGHTTAKQDINSNQTKKTRS